MTPAYLEQLQASGTPYQIIQQDMGEGQEPGLLFVVSEGQIPQAFGIQQPSDTNMLN